MTQTYFWITSDEDGTRVQPMTAEQVLVQINDGTKRVFLKEVPRSDKGYWMGVPEHSVLLIKGEVVIPQPVERVTEYTL